MFIYQASLCSGSHTDKSLLVRSTCLQNKLRHSITLATTVAQHALHKTPDSKLKVCYKWNGHCVRQPSFLFCALFTSLCAKTWTRLSGVKTQKHGHTSAQSSGFAIAASHRHGSYVQGWQREDSFALNRRKNTLMYTYMRASVSVTLRWQFGKMFMGHKVVSCMKHVRVSKA